MVFWEEIILAITFKNIISTSAFIIKYKQVKKRKGKKMKAKKIASVLMLIGMFVVVALLSSCDKGDEQISRDERQIVSYENRNASIS